MLIKQYVKGEEKQLWQVFYSSIHINAKNYYNNKQLDAWAPNNLNYDFWCKKLNQIKPYVIHDLNKIIGYGDLQDSGYIDHFFIRGSYSNQGYGSALIKFIIKIAKEKNIPYLESYVSLAAQTFFEKYGFKIIKKNIVDIRGQKLENYLMRVDLDKSYQDLL